MGTAPFTRAINNIKYLDVTLTKEVKDLYEKNFKSLKKETEKDIRKWKDLPCPWNSRFKMVKTDILPKPIYRFKEIPIIILAQFFTDLERTIHNFICKNKQTKKTRNLGSLNQS